MADVVKKMRNLSSYHLHFIIVGITALAIAGIYIYIYDITILIIVLFILILIACLSLIALQQLARTSQNKKTIIIYFIGRDMQWKRWLEWRLKQQGWIVEADIQSESMRHPLTYLQENASRTNYTLSIISCEYWDILNSDPKLFHEWKKLHSDATKNRLIFTRENTYKDFIKYKPKIDAFKFTDKITEDEAQMMLQKISPKHTQNVPSSLLGQDQPRYPWSPYIYPPDRNPHFIGREDYLENIDKAIPEGTKVILLLYGLIGIGKTEIAKEYAYRNRDRYTHIFWLNMRTPTQRESDLREICKRLNLPLNIPSNFIHDKNSFFEWLAIHNDKPGNKYLFIFDECEGPEEEATSLVIEFLSHIGNHTVLITANSTVNSLETEQIKIERMEVKPMQEAEAIKLLLDFTKKDAFRENREIASKIAEKLGYIPEALEAASIYINENENFSTYIYDYQNSLTALTQKYNTQVPKELLKKNGQQPVIFSWWLYFEKIKQSKAATILTYCVMLDPTAIPIELLKYIPGLAADELTSEIGKLHSHFLVNHYTENTLSLNPHVRNFFEYWLKTSEKKQLARKLVKAFIKLKDLFTYSNPENLKQYNAQFRTCEHLISIYKLTDIDVADFYQVYGFLLQKQGQDGEAGSYYQKSIDIIKQNNTQLKNSTDSDKIAVLWLNDHIRKVETSIQDGKYTAAETLLNESIQQQEQFYGEYHPSIATSYYQLARLSYLSGDQPEFQKTLNKLENIWKQILNGELPPTTHFVLLKEQGLLYYMQCTYKESIESYKSAIDIANTIIEEARKEGLKYKEDFFKHEKQLCEAQQARCYVATGQKEKFEDVWRKYLAALEITTHRVGQDHPQIAPLQSNLADLFLKWEDPKKALEHSEKAEQIYKSISDTHPQLNYIRGSIKYL